MNEKKIIIFTIIIIGLTILQFIITYLKNKGVKNK